MALTPKQERFVTEYLVDLNATQAAIRSGYSAKTANEQGARLLANASVAAAVAVAQQQRAARVEVTQDEVLTELLTLLRSDVRDFQVSNEGELTLREGAPDNAWRAVSSVKHRITTRGDDDDPFVVREIEFRLWDKPGAIKLAGQHIGMFKDRVEHSADAGLAGLIADAFQRGSGA